MSNCRTPSCRPQRNARSSSARRTRFYYAGLLSALEPRLLLAGNTLTLPSAIYLSAESAPMATTVPAGAAANTSALPSSYTFNHPSIALTLEDLDTIKANLNQEPYKTGFVQLANASTSQLSWPMEGPFTTVTRNPNLNLNYFSDDMSAVWNCARMWYFTGNAAYAQKAHDILLAWATTQTSFGGQESGLALGDMAPTFVTGADILRGTWSGWTAADTATVKNYFENVLWPATAANGNTAGPFNKGLLNIEAGIALAAFCDDTAKFNHCIDLYLNYPGAGLNNTLPTGELGETGRDEGHSYGGLLGMAFISEVAWKHGVDLYSAMDNRLLACGEYYARNTLITDNPFVPFGTVDYTYYANNPYLYTANRIALSIIQNAYKNRLGIPTPWIDRKLQQQPVDSTNAMYTKTADFSIAPVQPVAVRPSVSLASSGLTLTTLGSQTAGRSASYANGVWTLTGAGNNVWSDTTDDAQFDYQAMTGDCAFVARLTSSQVLNTNTKAGLMIRDNLSPTVSQRGWIGVTNGTLMESYMNGWTETWGGSNWAKRSQTLPPGLPYWLKVERRGNLITTYSSQDGTSWSAIESSYYGNLPSTLYVGFFVCSGSSATTTATFDNVAFTGGTGGLVNTPAAPATLFAEGSSKAITVRWLPSFGASAYDLLRSTTSGSGYTLIASDLATDKTSYVDTSVTAGTTYYYVVRAKNAAGTSANSPEFGDSLLPAPMVNLAFSGTATDSASNASNAGNAFDRNPGSQWFYTGTSGWLQYDFGANNAQVVKRYTVSEADTIAARDPRDWTFLASQDGTNWTTLDSQTGQTFAYWYQQITYNLANTTAYRYYRLNVTANNGDTTFLHVGELGLWSDTGRTLPDGTYVLDNRPSHKVIDLAAGGTPAVQQTWTGGNTQQWTLAWQGNGVYRITDASTGKVLDNGGTSTAGANIALNTWSGASSQLWKIVPDSDGFYHLTSLNSGLVMDLNGGSNTDGANIVQSAYTGAGSQLWMPGFSAVPTPIPAAPTGLSATPASIYQINLSWTASPGAISYNIKRASVTGGPYTTIATGINTPSYQDSYLTVSTTYYYVVSPQNGSGEGADSTEASATTLTAPPAAPTGLTVQPGASKAILNWTITGGAASYTVQRATTTGGPYTTVASNVTGTTYTDTTVLNGTTYYYVLVAVNSAGASPLSSEVNVTPSDLAVQLKFDEGSGTTAYDGTGNGWNGTLVNGPVWNTTGKINGDLTLDGTNDYVSLPTGVINGQTAITISAWVNLTSLANWQRIFDLGTGTTNYMFLSPKNGATGKLRFAILTPSSGGEQIIDGTAALPTGVWTHVAITINGTVGRLYVNGTQVGQNTNMSVNASALGSTTLNYLGKSQFSADPYLNGQIDDFRIYGNALTASQIQTLATTAVPAAPTGLTANVTGTTQVNLSWNPVAGATTYHVYRATASGGPFTPVSQIASNLTTTSYSYQDNALPALLDSGNAYYYVVSAENAGGEGAQSQQAAILPYLPDAPAAPTVNVALSGSLALTWVTASNVLSYTVSRATSIGGPYTTVASGLTGTTFTDTGLADAVTYYYTITAVNAAGGTVSPPTAATSTDLYDDLKMNDGSGTTAIDASGHGYAGTLVNGPTWTTGKIGGAVNLSGSSQYIVLPNAAVPASSTVSISAWVNLTSLSTWARIFDFGTGTTKYMFLTPKNGANNVVRFGITTGGTAGEQKIDGTAALPTGAWTHVAVVLDGAVGTLYVNGVQVGQNTAMTLTPASLGALTQNYLGKSQFNDPYLNGKIDDFRIYSRALSASEVTALSQLTPPTITNLNDAGPGSLRAALAEANNLGGSRTLTFASGLTGTLTPTAPLPPIGASLLLTASSPILLAGASPLLTLSTTSTLQLRNLTLSPTLLDTSLSSPTSVVGLYDNSDLGLSSYKGQTLLSSSLLVTYAAPGDTNLDGNVDLADYDRWFLHVGGTGNANSRGDLNLDGNVDLADYDLWFTHVGITAAPLTATTTLASTAPAPLTPTATSPSSAPLQTSPLTNASAFTQTAVPAGDAAVSITATERPQSPKARAIELHLSPMALQTTLPRHARMSVLQRLLLWCS